MIKHIEKLFTKLENLEFKLKDWIFVFVSVILIKMIMDALSGNSIFTMNYIEIFIHSMFIYLFTALILMIIVIKLTRQPLKKVAGVSLIAIFTLPLVNIIDLTFSAGKDYFRAYIFQSPTGVIHDFITFFGGNPTTGITYGMRIQTALVCIALGVYIFIRTKKYWKAILGGLLGYTTMFCCFALPSIIANIILFIQGKENTPQSVIAHFAVGRPLVGNFLIPRYNIFDIKFSLWLAVFITIALFLLQLTADKKKAWAFFKNLRLTRVLSQLAPYLGGFAVAYILTQNKPYLGIYEWLSFAVLGLAILWNWIFGLCLNDIYDIDVDKQSKANNWRPLPSGIMSIPEFWSIAFISFLMSSVLALLVDYRFFLFMSVLNAIVYIYSTPPIRLRRFIFLSNTLIAFLFVLVVMMGAMFMSSSPHIQAFPREILIAVFVIIFLIASIKDVKDREADKQNGITTIPTLFGEKKGKLVTATMFTLAYFVVPIALREPMLFLVATGFGIFTFLILAANKLQERLMFVVTLCYILIVFLIVYI